MADKDATTPRVFIARHGETEWAKNGRYTGLTDIALTETGVAQVAAAATALVGAGKVVDPSRLARVVVSPRVRAVRTAELLLGGAVAADKMRVTEDIAEWNYGDYEGLKTHEIRALRKSRGLDTDKEWDIWTDGCEGGESSQQIADRLDQLIAQIRALQAPYMSSEQPADVLLVAHGHILRCFVKRWLGYPLGFPLQMMLAPGAIAALSYRNKSIQEPSFYLGLALPVSSE